MSVGVSSRVIRIAVLGTAGLVGLASIGTLAAGPSFLVGWRWIPVVLLILAVLAYAAVFVVAGVRGKEEPMTAATKTEEMMYSVRNALLTQRMAVLQSSHDQLESELARLRTERDAHAAARAMEPAPETADLRDQISRLEQRLAETDAARQRAEERATGNETRVAGPVPVDAGRAQLEQRLADVLATQAQHLADIARLRTLLEAAQESERHAQEATTEFEQDAVILRAQLAALPSVREDAERGRKATQENETLRTRLSELESTSLTAIARADLAEGSLRRLNEVQREAAQTHAAETEALRQAAAEARSSASAELAALRARAEAAEEAVRAALREFGVDPAKWPLTSDGVTQAVSPLTLFALGEDTQGWTPSAPEDTLAAAVLHVARLAVERQRQIERLGAALAQTGGRR